MKCLQDSSNVINDDKTKQVDALRADRKFIIVCENFQVSYDILHSFGYVSSLQSRLPEFRELLELKNTDDIFISRVITTDKT